MHLTADQKSTLEDRLQEVVDKAKSIYGIDLGFVDISFSLKGRIAAKAHWINVCNRHKQVVTAHTFKVSINQEAAKLDWDDMYNNTIPHEVAHLVCGAEPTLGANHNSGWQSVCIALGGDGKETHSMKLTPGRTTKRFIYTATCGTQANLSHVIHNRIQNGQVRVLRRTGGKLNKSCAFVQTYKT